jgi:hypothetical protein
MRETDDRYWVYQIARACQALTMGDTTRTISERHAREIVDLEKFLHIDIELGLQHFVMKHNWLLVFFNKCVPPLIPRNDPESTCIGSSADKQNLCHGPHSRDDRLYGILVPLLPASNLPVDPTNSCPVQHARLHHLLFLAVHATQAPTLRRVWVRGHSTHRESRINLDHQQGQSIGRSVIYRCF